MLDQRSEPIATAIIPVTEWTYRLPDALTSVFGQSYGDVEAIVVIQPSLFEGEIEKVVRGAGSRTQYIVPDTQGTRGSMLQAGLQIARGSYVGWLGPNDLWDPRKLEWQLAAIRESGSSAVCAGPVPCPDRSGYSTTASAVASPIAALLAGWLDPESLLIPRACLEIADQADASLDALYTLDLSLRIAARFPFFSVDTPLVEHRGLPPEHAPVYEKGRGDSSTLERHRLYASLLARTGFQPNAIEQDGRLEILRQTADLLAPGSPAPVRCLLDELTKVAGPETLTIVSMGSLAPAGSNTESSDEQLAVHPEVPAARCVRLETQETNWARRARHAADLDDSEYLVLASSETSSVGIPLLGQLLQAKAERLVACLPVRDPLKHEVAGNGEERDATLVPWTVFHRSALQRLTLEDTRDEGRFWTMLGHIGRIGALPAAPVERPLRHERPPAIPPEGPVATPVQIAASPPVRTVLEHALALVDRDWYLSAYPDVAADGADPTSHYVNHGWREGRDPNPWFSTNWYVARNPDVMRSGTLPLLDFVSHAEIASRRPHPGFFPCWYASRYPGSGDVSHALEHFLTIGCREGALPDPRLDRAEIHQQLNEASSEDRPRLVLSLHAALPSDDGLSSDLVDGQWYMHTYPDIAEAGVDPVEHYLSFGWRESRDPNAWFSTDWYLKEVPEAASWEACPIDHFVLRGAAEGLRPSPSFDPAWYARRYLNQSEASAHALRHFLQFGWAAGALPDPSLDDPKRGAEFEQCPRERQPALVPRMRQEAERAEELLEALVDPDWYALTYPDAVSAPADAARHYLAEGWKAAFSPNPWFAPDYYQANNPDVAGSGQSPLEHFVRSGALAGQRPHPNFDIGWYSLQYLNGQTDAEALRHFLRVGIEAGAVPHPALHGASVRDWLLNNPALGRTDRLRRLLSLVSPPDGAVTRWQPDDAELWPVLLRRRFPSHALGVLLLCRTGGEEAAAQRAAARAAAAVLPLTEYPLFCGVDDDGGVILCEDLGDKDAVAVEIRLPGDAEALRALLMATRCHRAACVSDGLEQTSFARAIRKAELPITVNGRARRASQ